MHRLILGLVDSNAFVDHCNGHRLDNRRANLRVCTHAENVRNRKISRNNRSGFKGVWFVPDRKSRPWRASVQVGRTPHGLGYFATAEEAALAYDDLARALHGQFALTNFPLPP